MQNSYPLRYGNNPHQLNASFTAPAGAIEFLNGSPSHINLLDILTGWQIVRDLSTSLSQVSAVSMKHCTPVGLAVPGPVDELTKTLIGRNEFAASSSCYLRARSADWSAAYGDVAVIFGEIDDELASILLRVVSDGIAATSFTKKALQKLSSKKGGGYLVARLDQNYVPPALETRDVFGFTVIQERNDYIPNAEDFKVSAGSPASVDASIEDLKLAICAMKYTVSNNIMIVSGGRSLSIAAGQQSRILATELACSKLLHLLKLQTPKVLDAIRTTNAKLVDKVLLANKVAASVVPDKSELKSPMVMASDGFIPFNDNIDLALKHGIEIILEPEGAMRSSAVEQRARESNITLVRTKQRFFYH